MSNRNIDVEKNKLSFQTITTSDTISQFMEKVNNNFKLIDSDNAGPAGVKGEKGDQGVPTKPKVPIHAWKKGVEYIEETESKIENETIFEIPSTIENKDNIKVDLKDSKYQEGHLIMLENGHVYILELTKDFILNPKFLIAVQSFDPNSVIDGKTAYVHIAYAEDIINGMPQNFKTDQELRNGKIIYNFNELSTYNTLDSDSDSDIDIIYLNNIMYIGIYSDNEETSSESAYRYTWFKIREYDYKFSLSNPASIIIVDENNCCINDNVSSTSVFLYKNNLDISKENDISVSLEDNTGHFSTRKINDINEIVFNPFIKNVEPGKPDVPFEFKSDSYNLHITLENKNNTYKNTIVWTLIPIKISEIKVFVDKKIINTSISGTQTFNVGYYLISPSKKEIIKEKDENYDIILTDNFEDKTKYNVLSEWNNVEYNFIDKDGKNKTCYVILVDKNDNIIDYTTITTINDGYSMSLDLTEDHFILPYNIDRTGIHKDYNSPISSQILLYNNKLIDNLTNYKFSFYDQSDVDITSYITVDNNGNFNIPIEFLKNIKDNTKIKCVNEDFQLQKTIYIEFKETPYKLELDKLLTRGTDNLIIEERIKVYLKYYIDNLWKESTEENIIIKASWGNDRTEDLIFYEGYYYMNINSEKFKDIKNIKISCVKDDNELFSETIVILNDGKNGTTYKLDTNPDNDNNKVYISDTNIIIKDDEGKELVKISSDVVNNTENKLYTQIGKDGISIKQIGNEDEEKYIFTVSNNEILMQIGEYGIKITNEGITKIEPNLEPNN